MAEDEVAEVLEDADAELTTDNHIGKTEAQSKSKKIPKLGRVAPEVPSKIIKTKFSTRETNKGLAEMSG